MDLFRPSLTAYNFNRAHDGKNPMPYTDPQAIEAYTKKYCADHPLKYVFDAASQMVIEQTAGL